MLPSNFQYMKHGIIRRQFYGAQAHRSIGMASPPLALDVTKVIITFEELLKMVHRHCYLFLNPFLSKNVVTSPRIRSTKPI
jgi:hypothetical protein